MRRPKIYVIDDDQAMLESTVFLLRSAGFECDCFRDARAFLQAIGTLEPGCVLTDLRMPEMNGYELQKALSEVAPAWPIILMTSENGSLNARAAAAHGFIGFLRKPFPADALLAAIAASCPGDVH
jgi:two-component system response regulator FixJ